MCIFILYSYYSKFSFVLAFRAASLPLLGFVATVLHFSYGPRLFILTSVTFMRSVSDLPLLGVLDGPVVRRGYYHPLFIDIIIFSPLGL